VQSDVPSALDLNALYDDEFSPDKLGTVMQRLYMTAVTPTNRGIIDSSSLEYLDLLNISHD
jgi:hypothetical protein